VAIDVESVFEVILESCSSDIASDRAIIQYSDAWPKAFIEDQMVPFEKRGRLNGKFQFLELIAYLINH